MRYLDLYDEYVQGVMSGTLPINDYARKAVERQVKDLERDDWEYIWHPETAEWTLKTFKGFVHTQGEKQNQAFDLQPWQAFVIAVTYGWLSKHTGYRRYIRSTIMIPRKNGKTELEGAKMAYAFAFDGEKGAEVYSTATQKEQADKAFHAAHYMISKIRSSSPYYNSIIKQNDKECRRLDDRSIMKALSRERDGNLDGLNASYVCIDELHAHKNRKMIDVMESSDDTRPQSLISKISTAGMRRQGPCYDEQKMCEKLLDGLIQDDRLFAMIWTPDDGDDIYDPATWLKVNPNYGVSIVPEKFEAAALRAKNLGGAKEVEFRVKRLNEWADTASTWIPHEVVIQSRDEFSWEDMRGRRCFVGLDLATVYDFNSAAFFFPKTEEDPVHRVLMKNWIGKDSVNAKRDQDLVDYIRWINEGWITANKGLSTNYKKVKKDILDIRDKYGVDIVELAYDRHNCYEIIADLIDEGIECHGFGQGYISMNMPVKAVDKLYRNACDYPMLAGLEYDDDDEEEEDLVEEHDEIRYNADPVLEYAFSNVAIKIDPAGNWKIDKDESGGKVDPCVALVMSYGQYVDYLKRPKYDVGIGVAII